MITDATASMVPILFVTLAPSKIVPIFHLTTRGVGPSHRRSIAIRAFFLSALVVTFIVLVLTRTRVSWGVSTGAVSIAGGVILFGVAYRSIMAFDGLEAPVSAPEPASSAWLGRPVLTPLAVPTIITPSAVAALIVFFDLSSVQHGAQPTYFITVAGLLMSNLAAMMGADLVIRLIPVALFQVVGWAFAILQAGFAVEVTISALQRLTSLS